MTTVRTEDREGNVRLLTLDRPPANAENEELLRDLGAALDAAGKDPKVRAVVLTGAGRFFSGGIDLPSFPADQGLEEMLLGVFHDTYRKLFSFPKPTVAMVNGHAIAGGLILALACDYRLGVEGDWKLGLNEVAIGATYPKVAIEIVKLRLPHARAAELLLGAGLYPASEAVRLGVVDELLPAQGFEATVLRRAARLGSFPRDAYADTKAELLAEALARIDAETPETAARRMALWRSPESVAARAAQRERLGKGR